MQINGVNVIVKVMVLHHIVQLYELQLVRLQAVLHNVVVIVIIKMAVFVIVTYKLVL